MAKHTQTHALTPTKAFLGRLLRWFGRTWRKAWWTKTIFILLGLAIFTLTAMYGIARWYVASNSDKPLQLGASFAPDYARSLGLDAEETMDALIKDVGVKRFRLVSYWSNIERTQGTYDFDELDWQFEKAEKAKAKVTLAIGLRQPRWPECHMPEWAKQQEPATWQPKLENFMTTVINRYKNSPSLESYQLENEALLKDFGECPETSRERLQQEFDLVKKLDPNTPIIMSRSNNFPPLLALGKPQADQVGMSVYRRVWDAKFTGRYQNYPLPSWYYASLAGWQKIFTGKESVLHELQMEPWPPEGKFVADVSVEEQDKSMNADMFAGRINFAKNTGMRKIDLWGAEWWYYRKVVHNDSKVWDEAKKAFRENEN